MADSATIDGGEAIGRVLRYVRCNIEVPHVGHEVSRIEALVATHGDALGARRIAHDHVFRGFALDHIRHLTQFRLDDEAVAVLRHDVARISELCLLTLALLGAFGLGVRGGAVRLIAALLAVKMALAVAPRRWRVTRTVLRHKALHRCPSLNLRAVDGKVVVRKQGSHLPMSEKLGQEFACHLGFEQPLTNFYLSIEPLGGRYRLLPNDVGSDRRLCRDRELDHPSSRQYSAAPAPGGDRMTTERLILKRASTSRSSGEWSDDDYDVLADGIVVGRVMKAAAAPVGTLWLWTLAYGQHEDRTPTHGYAATREAAMAAFAKSWRRG